MTDEETFKLLIFILAKKNGGTLTLNKIDLLQFYPTASERLFIDEDVACNRLILEVKDVQEKK